MRAKNRCNQNEQKPQEEKPTKPELFWLFVENWRQNHAYSFTLLVHFRHSHLINIHFIFFQEIENFWQILFHSLSAYRKHCTLLNYVQHD